MSNFPQIMHDWKRMCVHYEKINEEDPCSPCPLFGQCGAIFEMDDETDWKEYANIISNWAAENPELRWIDLLKEYDIFDENESIISLNKLYQLVPSEVANQFSITKR